MLLIEAIQDGTRTVGFLDHAADALDVIISVGRPATVAAAVLSVAGHELLRSKDVRSAELAHGVRLKLLRDAERPAAAAVAGGRESHRVRNRMFVTSRDTKLTPGP